MILLAKKIQHFVDLIVAKSLSHNEEEIFRLNHADEKLYQAKNAGRNCVRS
jgi:hypothetical protein